MTADLGSHAPTGNMIDLATAAAYIGFPYQKVWELVVAGIIPSIRAGRTFRVPEALFTQARERGCTGSLVLETFAEQWKTQPREARRGAA